MRKSFCSAMSGITLVEITVVIAIVAIMTTIAIPNFISMTQRYRAISSANAFEGDLRLARSVAQKQGAPVTICTSSNGTSCTNDAGWQAGWIVFSDPAANKTVGMLLRRQQPWKNTDTFTPDSPLDAITFNREGFPTSLPGPNGVTFTLRSTPVNAAATQCVSLTRTGRLKMTTGSGTCS